MQFVKVFFSPEDIEKGDNWDKIISTELSECKYGIICLTTENTAAPWINFEAGAIAKSLDSKVTALMVNIKPSDIKGPLSRYQATRFEKEDFFQLISSINKVLENPLELAVLQNTFNGMWSSLENEANKVIMEYSDKKKLVKDKTKESDLNNNAPLEEILQLLRQQSAILSNPEKLMPIEYLNYVQRKFSKDKKDLYNDSESIIKSLCNYCKLVVINLDVMEKEKLKDMVSVLNFNELLNIMLRYTNHIQNRAMYIEIIEIRQMYHNILESSIDHSDSSNENI